MTPSLLRVTAAAGVLLWLALPAAADGLSKFEQKIKPQLPPNAVTYKSAKALGENGFVLEGVVVTPPPDATAGQKAQPVEIKRVAVDDFDFAGLEKQSPTFAKIKFEGITISGKPAEGIDLAQLAGIDKITADVVVDYRLDAANKTMTLNKLEFDVTGLARAELTMVIDGVTPDLAGKADAAMNDVSLRTATLTFEDRSLLSKVLPAAAKAQGTEVAMLIGMGKGVLDGLRAGQSAPTLAVIDAFSSYIEDYKAPKGPLKITLNPPSKASAASVNDFKSPDDAINKLGIVVSYAGTKPGAPPSGGAPSTAQPASAPATGTTTASGSCSAGARFFVMHEDAWWSATVRDAAKSGNECILRLDAGGAEDLAIATDKLMAWSIDGPGKGVDKCASGDKVLVEQNGGWYAAQVTPKGAIGAQCSIKFEVDEEEEKVELKRMRKLN